MRRYLIAGMSHVESLRRGFRHSGDDASACKVDFLNLNIYQQPSSADAEAIPTKPPSNRGFIAPDAIASQFANAAEEMDAVVLSIKGNEHNIIGLAEIDSLDDALRRVENHVKRNLDHWVCLLRPVIRGQIMLLIPPPPIESEAHIREYPGPFREKFEEYPLRAATERLKIWRRQCDVTRRYGKKNGIKVLEPSKVVFSATGFLANDCLGVDPTHGNSRYGRHVMRHLLKEIQGIVDNPRAQLIEDKHPYADLPDHAYWKQSISEVEGCAVDPVVHPRFVLQATDKVATAGSCFAQHISKRLRTSGFKFLVTEQASDHEMSAEDRGFYDFSARYGNVYTSRQLLQLFDRAFGYFKPLERAWPRPGGGFCDPFRPRIEPDGFASEEAVFEDTLKHLDAVRRMFLELDVFVFTLGLTECWISRLDGAVYPLAPGVAGGRYDPSRHAYVNFGVAEVKADMEAFLVKLKLVNPTARVLLTVSPVPLAATQEERHVLVSTIYSKSVLRVAAEELVAAHTQVEYFPSYEIITGPHAGSGYFAADRRSVTQAGVDHVMRVFMTRMTDSGESSVRPNAGRDDVQAYVDMEAAAETACDEEMYARGDITL